MSERDLTRLRVLIDLGDNRLTAEAAGTLIGVGRRQALIACAVLSPSAGTRRRWSRGGVVGRAIAGIGETFRQTVLTLVRQHYSDFGPMLAAEKLAARHGLNLGVETLRQWMIADGLWQDRRHRLPSPARRVVMCGTGGNQPADSGFCSRWRQQPPPWLLRWPPALKAAASGGPLRRVGP